ncbi:MAG: ABC transporter ATP-binding protein [Sneathiella sp.]|nr:ABC transporter ATP-binding protein [Sneathiella sp.]
MSMQSSKSNMVALENLDVWFDTEQGPFHAVKDVSITIKEGESFGLVGESGSGKSTILKAITGLAPKWSGSMAVNNQLLGAKRDQKFYTTVQMVFQDPYASLHPRHTVDRCLSEPLKLQKIRDIDHRVEQALKDVGLGSSFRFRYPHQLSGGQRQRIAIARALIQNAKLLLLDEPTSALDVSVQAEILNLLSDIKKERGLTYLLVSHDLAVISHMCDRIAVMQQCKIVETMGTESLRTATPASDYTASLLKASQGFKKTVS